LRTILLSTWEAADIQRLQRWEQQTTKFLSADGYLIDLFLLCYLCLRFIYPRNYSHFIFLSLSLRYSIKLLWSTSALWADILYIWIINFYISFVGLDIYFAQFVSMWSVFISFLFLQFIFLLSWNYFSYLLFFLIKQKMSKILLIIKF